MGQVMMMMMMMVSYFCEMCAQFWEGAPIQIRDKNTFKDVCFDCMVKGLNRWRQEIRDERKKKKGGKVLGE